MEAKVDGDKILPFLHGIIEGMESTGMEDLSKNSAVGEAMPPLLSDIRYFHTAVQLESQLKQQDKSQLEILAKLDSVAEDVLRLKTRERSLDEWLTLQDTAMSDIRKLYKSLDDRVHKSLDAGLEEVHLEVAKLCALHDAQCLELNQLRQEASGGFMEAQQQIGDRAQLEVQLTQCHDFIEQLGEEFRRLRQELQSEVRECRGEFFGQLDESKDHVNRLRIEIKDALTNEASIITSLDEQLWHTDKQLGKRLDNLAQSHCECMAIIERRIECALLTRAVPEQLLASNQAVIDTVARIAGARSQSPQKDSVGEAQRVMVPVLSPCTRSSEYSRGRRDMKECCGEVQTAKISVASSRVQSTLAQGGDRTTSAALQ